MRRPRLPYVPGLHHDPPKWKTAAEEKLEAEQDAATERERMKRQPMKRKSMSRGKKSSEIERAVVLAICAIVGAALLQAVLAWAFHLPGLSWLVDVWHWIGANWQSTTQ